MNKIFALVLLSLSGIINAAPISFNFQLPDWTSTQPAWPYGSNANLNVTLDNGNNNFLNQIYLNSNILEITVTSGSFNNTWLASDILDPFIMPDLNISYFSTDLSGTPILDLTGPGDTRVAFENDGGYFTLGTREWSGPTTVWLEDAPNFNGWWANIDSEDGIIVTGSVIPTTVPVPPTMLLFISGLFGLLFVRKKHA
jgi:hypothetical protein